MALRANHKRSNREVAQHCGIGSHHTVQTVREELESTGQIAQSNERVGSDGRTTNTANIGKGKKKKSETSEPDPTPESQPPKPPPIPSSKPTFNRTNDNIEWAAWSWTGQPRPFLGKPDQLWAGVDFPCKTPPGSGM